jgi:carboxylesterase
MSGAEPFSFDGSNDVGVVLIHGFTGSPKSMVPWGRALADQGWTVRVPRLPGHGTRWQDMNVTTWQDWVGEADRNVAELLERCTHVFVMGLSMGGAITLRIAEERGDAITGIVLVNTAVHTERKDRFLLPFVKHVIPSFPGISNDIAMPGQDEGAYDRLPLRAAASLSELWSLVRAGLSRVQQPILLLRSKVDHVVEPSNARMILAEVKSTDVNEIVLERSFHVATLDFDAPLIIEESIAFIRRLAKQSS